MLLTARNAGLAELTNMLKDQQTRKFDVVTPADGMGVQNGVLYVDNTELQGITDDGNPITTQGAFVPTSICDEGIAAKLGIPVNYLKRLRTDRTDLYDVNVNGWLHGNTGLKDVKPDPRSFLVRTYKTDNGPGIARAFLSERYSFIDNFDVLFAALEGVRKTGVQTKVEGCDLTERRMYVKVSCPEVAVMAPTLLEGYRSPFNQGVVRANDSGETQADDLPIVFAGFVISNSETGGGAFQIVPRITVQICKNGMTMSKDAQRNIHLGGKLDDGVVTWSEETGEKQLALIQSMTTDSVQKFLSKDYLQSAVEQIESKSQTHVSHKQVQVIGQQLRFSEDKVNSILEHFTMGGQTNAGGLLNAITSYAQTINDPDEANDVENSAMKAFDAATR